MQGEGAGGNPSTCRGAPSVKCLQNPLPGGGEPAPKMAPRDPHLLVFTPVHCPLSCGPGTALSDQQEGAEVG